MADGKVYTFRNPTPLARAVVGALWFHIAGSFALGCSSLLVIESLRGVDPSLPKDTPLTSDLPAAFAALIYLAAVVTVGFLILKWIYRVDRNVHSATSGLTISPPWAVGWYFVPVACLWKPFQALRETWQVSTQIESWREVPVPARLRWWWGLWIASGILGQASLRASMHDRLGSQELSAMLDLIATPIDVALDIVFIRIVRELTAMQVANIDGHSALTTGALDKPSPDLTPTVS